MFKTGKHKKIMKCHIKFMTKRCSGLTLIEILLGIFLGSLVLVFSLSLYLGSKDNFTRTSNITSLQNNMRIATSILTKNIREAGFIGCGRLFSIDAMGNITRHKHVPFTINSESNLYGFTILTLPKYLRGKVRDGTDAISLQKIDGEMTTLLEDVVGESSTIKVLKNPITESNNFILISDCDHVDIFQSDSLAAYNTIKIFGKSKIKHAYKIKDTRVGKFVEMAFFISQSSPREKYGLFMIVNGGDKEEIVSGVSDMKIFYGIDGNYYTARDVTRSNIWKKVRSVRMELVFEEDMERSDRGKVRTLILNIGLRER